MSILKNIITTTYHLRMKISKLTGLGIRINKNENQISAPETIYRLSARLNKGEEISFERYRDKKLLIVNLASKCGYTPQYRELESLHQKNEDLVILGFPSNNFGDQEPGTDEDIAGFCRINFNVTFPLFLKNHVIGKSKQPVYEWLTNKDKNGWNDLEPRWNFYKYLIDENGNLLNVFSPAVSPLDIKIVARN
ncbi:MAG: glutathione peroxidase [Ginsengibacter sp.]